MPDLQEKPQRASSAMAGMLALFVMLLAFFIVFTADVEFNEDKVTRALDGLQTAFPVAPLANQAPDEDLISHTTAGGRAWQTLRDILTTENGALQLALKLRQTSQGMELIAYLPLTAIQAPQSQLLSKRILTALRATPNLQCDLQMRDDKALNADYLGIFADKLTQGNADVQRIKLTLNNSIPSNQVKIVFTLHSEDDYD